jgi:hypothetical protein
MNFHRRTSGDGSRSMVHRITSILLGTLLIILGGLLGLAPLLPGIVFGVVGAALIVAQLRFAAVFLDKGELWCRKVFARKKTGQ